MIAAMSRGADAGPTPVAVMGSVVPTIPASDRATMSEAAFLLSKSYNQTHRLVLTRQVRGERVGSHWYVSRASVQDFLSRPQ